MKMRINGIRHAALTVSMLLCVAIGDAARAHHSTAAEFDQNKPISFTGMVNKVVWLNPHIYTHVTVKQANGADVTYRVEGGPPNSLFRNGWRKDSLRPGDTVTVSGWMAKDPDSQNVGQATITSAEGRRIFSGNGPAKSVNE
jgi:hypothetical protein